MLPMRFAWLVASVLVLSVSALTSCGPAPARVVPNTREEHLLHILRADPHVLVQHLEREANGDLVVTTRQGAETIRYRMPKDARAQKTSEIQRIEDRVTISGLDDGVQGTGDDTRGLQGQ